MDRWNLVSQKVMRFFAKTLEKRRETAIYIQKFTMVSDTYKLLHENGTSGLFANLHFGVKEG